MLCAKQTRPEVSLNFAGNFPGVRLRDGLLEVRPRLTVEREREFSSGETIRETAQ